MFYGANAEIFKRAEILRTNPTKEEALLWKRINENQLGYRFKAQHPVANYIVDFYCHKFKLVIEVDGGIHFESDIREKDKGRTEELEIYGLKVIRFTNEDILNRIEWVVDEIKHHLKK
jgi:very-short-patch-repair endonuclease